MSLFRNLISTTILACLPCVGQAEDDQKFSKAEIFNYVAQGSTYVIHYIAEQGDKEAKKIDTQKFLSAEGAEAARLVANQLSSVQQEYQRKSQTAGFVKAGSALLFGGLGTIAGGPVGLEIGLAGSSIVEGIIDAGLSNSYRQIVADSTAVIEYNLNVNADDKVRLADKLIKQADAAQALGNFAEADSLRDQAASSVLQSGAFTGGLLNTEACKSMGKEACELALKGAVRNNTLRLDLNTRQIQSLGKVAATNSANIVKIKSALEQYQRRVDADIDVLQSTQQSIISELQILDSNISQLNDTVSQHDRQIGYLQHSAWAKMSTAEKLDALKSGTFFPKMDAKKRKELTESLEKRAENEKDEAQWQARIKLLGATSDLANELSSLGVIDADIANAISKVSFGAGLIAQARNLTSLTSLADWTSGISLAANALKLFGRSRPDPDQERFKAIMRAMGVLNKKLDEVIRLQQETLKAIERIDTKLDRLENSIDKRFDRLEAKVDFLTDLVSSTTVLPRSDACSRFIRYGVDRFGLNVASKRYDNYSQRLSHWNSGGVDLQTCREYVTQAVTVHRPQGPTVDAALLISQRDNSPALQIRKDEFQILVNSFGSLMGASEATPDCLDYSTYVLSQVPRNYLNSRRFFDYIRNLSKIKCTPNLSGPSGIALAGNYDEAAWAKSGWSTISNELDAFSVLAFSDIVLLLSDHERLLVNRYPQGTSTQITIDEIKLGADLQNVEFEGARRAKRNLERLLDILDIATTQSALKSGLHFLPFLERTMVTHKFGYGDSLPDEWHRYRNAIKSFELSVTSIVLNGRSEEKTVSSWRETRNALTNRRYEISEKVFGDSSGLRITTRDAGLDSRLVQLADLEKTISVIDKAIVEKRANYTDVSKRKIEDLENDLLKTLNCAIPNQSGMLTATSRFWTECFKVLSDGGRLEQNAVSSYLFAVFLLETFPDLAQNFWNYLALRNVTEGGYSTRTECFKSNSASECSYRFNGPSGNRKETSRFTLEFALSYPKDTFLKRLLPDYILADPEISQRSQDDGDAPGDSETQEQNRNKYVVPREFSVIWNAKWVGSHGDEKQTPIPSIIELLGKLNPETKGREGGAILYSDETRALFQKRKEVVYRLSAEEWAEKSVQIEEVSRENLEDTLVALSLMR